MEESKEAQWYHLETESPTDRESAHEEWFDSDRLSFVSGAISEISFPSTIESSFRELRIQHERDEPDSGDSITLVTSPPSAISVSSSFNTFHTTSFRDALLMPAKAWHPYSHSSVPPCTEKGHSKTNSESSKRPNTALGSVSDDFWWDMSPPPMPRGYMKGNRELGYRRSAGNGSRTFCRCSGCMTLLACARAGEEEYISKKFDGRFASKDSLLHRSLFIQSESRKIELGLTKDKKVRARRRIRMVMHEALDEYFESMNDADDST